MNVELISARSKARKDTPVLTRLGASLFVAMTARAVSMTAAAETYDVVINNGRVMDPETAFVARNRAALEVA